MDYGPALPPRLGSDLQNVSDQSSNVSEEPSKKVLDRPKKHSHKRHEVEPWSASDQYYEESDEAQMSSTKPKKHADKSRHKVRSWYVSGRTGSKNKNRSQGL